MDFVHGGNTKELVERMLKLRGFQADPYKIGEGQREPDLIDFSANINPLGPPAWLKTVILSHLKDVAVYPHPYAHNLVVELARELGVRPGQVVAASGSLELIFALPGVLEARRVVVLAPSFTEYERAAQRKNLPVLKVLLQEQNGFLPDLAMLKRLLNPGDLVFIGNPNNPTGVLVSPVSLMKLAGSKPRCWFVIDEAFVDFATVRPGGDEQSELTLTSCVSFVAADEVTYSNVLVLRSLTKFYAIPGLRLGFMVGPEKVAQRVRWYLPPWNVNCFGLAVGARLLHDASYRAETLRLIGKEIEWLSRQLGRLGPFRVFPTSANFLLVKIVAPGPDAYELSDLLLRRGIAIRPCGDFAGLSAQFFRLGVRKRRDNKKLVTALEEIVGEKYER